MSFVNGVVSVGTAAVPTCSPGQNGVALQNLGAAVVYVGGPGVQASGTAAAGGFQVSPGSVPVYLPPHGLATWDTDDQLYGRSSAGAVNVAYLHGP